MITTEDVDAAITFLRKGEDIAQARAEMVRCEDMLRHVKAVAMTHSNEKTAAAQERWACASPQYLEAINAKAEAVQKYEVLRAKREAAAMLISAWQTQEANNRGLDRIR